LNQCWGGGSRLPGVKSFRPAPTSLATWTVRVHSFFRISERKVRDVKKFLTMVLLFAVLMGGVIGCSSTPSTKGTTPVGDKDKDKDKDKK
jgi:hypothetical protein